MPARSIIRIVLSLGVLAVLWMRAIRDSWTGPWLAGSLVLTLVLLIGVGMELWQIRRLGRRPADQVPKHPLGLGS